MENKYKRTVSVFPGRDGGNLAFDGKIQHPKVMRRVMKNPLKSSKKSVGHQMLEKAMMKGL